MKPAQHYFLGSTVMSIAAVQMHDLLLLVAPNASAATLALKGHLQSAALKSGGIAFQNRIKVEELEYANYLSLAKALPTLNLFTHKGSTWSREVRVRAFGQGVSYARMFWTASEIHQLTMLLDIATHHRLTQARQDMQVEWLDADGEVAPETNALRTEIVVRPYDRRVALTAVDLDHGHDVRFTLWVDYNDFVNLFTGEATQLTLPLEATASTEQAALA